MVEKGSDDQERNTVEVVDGEGKRKKKLIGWRSKIKKEMTEG